MPALVLLGAAGCRRDAAPCRAPAPAVRRIPDGRISFHASPYAGGLSFAEIGVELSADGRPAVFVEESRTSVPNLFGAYGWTDLTRIVARADGVTRVTWIEALRDHPDTWIVSHQYLFDRAMRLDRSTPVFVTLTGGDGARVYYGPADDTEYLEEDYLGLPATDGYAKRGSMLHGGVPLNYAWNASGGVAVGVMTHRPGTYELPVSVDGERISLGATYAPSAALAQQTRFDAGERFNTDAVFVTYHRGDFFGPLERYARVLEVYAGRPLRDAPAPSWAALPHWKTWLLDPPGSGDFTPAQIHERIPLLQQYRIPWIQLDYGWFEAEGDWRPRVPIPFETRDGLQELVVALHDSGFKVGLWFQPVQLDPESDEAVDALGEHRIVGRDGEPFEDDDDLHLLDPSHDEVQEYVAAQVRSFGEMGIDHLYLDSQTAQLASPPNFADDDPLASHRALPGLYGEIRRIADEEFPGMVIEICPDGRSQSILNMPQHLTNIGDPKNDRQARAEFKSLKAIQGRRALVGTYVDPYGDDNPVSGSFQNMLGLGGKLMTMFEEIDGDAGLGAAEWSRWIDFYYEEDLVSGEYLDLYDIGFDRPEGHVVRKGPTLYYSFFVQTEGLDARVGCEMRRLEPAAGSRLHSGTIELRGLAPFTAYRVTRFQDGATLELASDDSGRATLDGAMAAFEKEVLYKVEPAAIAARP